jgi:hypothetical protein
MEWILGKIDNQKNSLKPTLPGLVYTWKRHKSVETRYFTPCGEIVGST